MSAGPDRVGPAASFGDRPVLVTGVTGQDGGYLAELLLAQGLRVHGLVRPWDSGRAELEAKLPGLELHEADLADPIGLASVVHEVSPAEIYHLAGMSSVAQSWVKPVEAGVVSGVAVAAILQAAWEVQERTGEKVSVVQAGSAEIFGDPTAWPQNEDTPIRPVNPYGAAKAFAHHLVGVYAARGLHAVSMVLYNHESPRRPETFVTRKITRGAALIARGELEELALGNLDARRDWGWAPDYVDAMVRAARNPESGSYVIATGVAHSVAEFVGAAFAAAGIADWERYVRIDPRFVRPVDAHLLVGDASRARAVLGWAPTVEFDEIVARMVRADLDGTDPVGVVN